MVTLTYVYDDPDHPDRPTSAIQSPPYIDEDVALLSGLDLYEQSLCKCGFPKHIAWHSDMDGWFESEEDVDHFVCFGCSAGRDPDDKVIYRRVRNTRPADKPMPEFRLGVTTVGS